MEEILASIRRIIADDQETLQIVQGPSEAKEGSPLRNVLDLTEQHVSAEILPAWPDPAPAGAVPPSDEEALPNEAPTADLPGSSKVGRGATPPAPVEKAPVRPAPQAAAEATLLSDATNASVLNAFDRLGASMVQSSPKTLEDLAREMLRPMLKTWLDDNLPLLVERLVQAEIERIARSRR